MANSVLFENIDIVGFKHIVQTFDFKENKVLLLNGDLGSGKTTFVKYFVTRYGFSENMVTSPTFTIAKVYENKEIKIFHLDLYRLSSQEELYYIGFEDMKADADFMLIEWPELAKPLLRNYVEVYLEFVDLEHRNVKIEFHGKPLR